jgi:microcin C transport system substrate-binding protein
MGSPFAIIRILLAALLVLALSACRRESSSNERELGFDEFLPRYNQYIAEWVRAELETAQNELAKIESEIPMASAERAESLHARAEVLRLDVEKFNFRLGLGNYLKRGSIEEIPNDLVWKNGMDQPEIGDPAAVKGGVFRRFIPSFPPTIRPFGSNSNNSFRGDAYDYIDLPLVALHPETLKDIPGLAKEWAESPDGRTIYFRLDPEARYSDGVPVRAHDFLVAVYLRVSDKIVNPYYKQFYRENMAQIAMYDDATLSVSLPETKAYAAALAGAITPSAPHFYAEYGADYNERYQWRFPPTTGAYEIRPDDIVKGVSITQTRVKDWWARDRKYYKHRFNPDKLVHTVVRDESKAFELFRAGELDTFDLTRPELWYEKSEIDPVHKGYIERVTFYNRYPKIPRGLYLNVAKAPLDKLDVRIGIQHAMNWQKVIDVMFRGDCQRLNAFNEGYETFSDPSIRSRPYSIELARTSFRKAGYTIEGRDGILQKPDGTRLSIALSYPVMPIYDRMLAILSEEAKACGFELRLDGLESTVLYKKAMQKQHEITIFSWMSSAPIPDFHQFLHSTNAIDEKGALKTQTNNIFSWHRADTDELSEKVRTARNAEELRVAAWKLQRIMHDEAIFVPAYTVDYMRIGSWRWVKWPDCPQTRFSPPVVFDPHEVFVFWVDEKAREETQYARRNDDVFPESTRVVDDYRVIAPTEGGTP